LKLQKKKNFNRNNTVFAGIIDILLYFQVIENCRLWKKTWYFRP